jgi:small subunit ribosomal protein S4|tara:strand:+ start:640 stop:1176 length:537 start_codon:yes stop_codon:yes gene_type:complete
MGDIKRKRKLFSRPKKLFDRTRMDEENVLVKKYGLKNKREIWKAKSFISKLRRRAKNLISSDKKEQQTFFDRLNRMGMGVGAISDVLALTEENLFERRLQTFVFKKKIANTPKQARQFIVHKNILVGGAVVNIPSFIVSNDLENKISFKVRKLKENKIKDDQAEAPSEKQIKPMEVVS